MGLKKCKLCKKVFAPTSSVNKICPKCLKEEEEQFKVVKDYLWDNPGSTIKVISKETGVNEKIIQKFVREGRFLQISGLSIKVECERCGAPIQSGRFCNGCVDKLRSGMSKIKESEDKEELEREKGKMYTKGRIMRK
ncbi:flagellar protein [Halonatronum saccharophilum]|uniref:flagellar protein n=1 Tax=Halonatronum saccharophilum TaxID=150060 RepID=UPI00048258A5|nr:flagellar protein [Halonatronum saccharophilum]